MKKVIELMMTAVSDNATAIIIPSSLNKEPMELIKNTEDTLPIWLLKQITKLNFPPNLWLYGIK